MPSVPDIGVPSVAPVATSGLPYQNAAGATPDAFGAGIGEAASRLGNQLDKTGDIFEKHTLKLQSDLNKATVDNTSIDYIQSQSALDVGFRSLEGKAAADGYQKYVQDSIDLRNKFSETLPNEEARIQFDQLSRGRLASSIHSEALRTGTEIKNYQSTANQRLMKTSTDLIANDPLSENEFTQAKELSTKAVKQQAEIHGWDSEETAAKLAENESNMLATRIQAAAQKDPIAAQKMFDENKDKLLPVTRQETETQLASGKYKAGSQAAVQAFALKRAVDADIESVAKTGVGVPGVNYATVRAANGEAGVEVWKAQRADAQKVWWHTYELPTTSIESMEKQLANISPTPGSPTFDRDQKVYDTVAEAMATQIKLRATDPAASVNNDPAVAEALKNQTPEGRQEVIMARLAAQTKAGIPPDLQSPVTVQEGVQLMQPLLRALPGSEHEALKQVAEQAKKQYGDNWEQAFTFSVRAAKLNSLKSLAAATTLKKVLNDETPTMADAARVDQASEDAEAQRTANLAPEPAPKKIPLSKRILEGK